MGIYAETSGTIFCNNKAAAEEAVKRLNQKNERSDDGNSYGTDLRIEKMNVKTDGNKINSVIYFFESSNRIQNLEYRCEEIWQEIKDIDGVISMDCPFLAEADGMHFDKDEKDHTEITELGYVRLPDQEANYTGMPTINIEDYDKE